MSIRDRLRRLEGRHSPEGGYQRPRYLERYFNALENIRRQEAGEDPLPYTEEDREDDRRCLQETIPAYRSSPGYQSGEGKAFLDDWQRSVEERLEKGP